MRQWRCRVARVRQQPLIFALVAADGVLRSVVRGRDVEAGREQPYLAGLAFQPPGQDQPGVVALVPGPGQVHRDPEGDGLVVAVAQPGQEGGLQAGLAGVPGGPDCGCGGPGSGRQIPWRPVP